MNWQRQCVKCGEINMIIRMVCETDFENWLPLWQGYQKFYKTVIPDSTTKITWSRFQDQREPMHCAVAEAGSSLIGFVHYIEHRSCWTAGDYFYLQDLYVDPSMRGQGVGRALIEHVYAAAKQAGASRVWWLTHESNREGMRLYDYVAERSGFLQYRKLL